MSIRNLTQEEIDKILHNVRTTLNIEGLEISEFSESIGRRYLNGELSTEQAIQIVKDDVLNNKKVRSNVYDS